MQQLNPFHIITHNSSNIHEILSPIYASLPSGFAAGKFAMHDITTL
jgi:hypothetical protein